jgi:uncharacterized membrane protein
MDAMYLLVHHLTGSAMNCGLTHGCDIVAASPYSAPFGIPLAALGVLFYTMIVLLVSIEYMEPLKKYFVYVHPRTLVLLQTSIGVCASLFFTYLQAYVIHAWCQYCLLSAFTTCVLFACALIRAKKNS